MCVAASLGGIARVSWCSCLKIQKDEFTVNEEIRRLREVRPQGTKQRSTQNSKNGTRKTNTRWSGFLSRDGAWMRWMG
jgi:hypothetical protein